MRVRVNPTATLGSCIPSLLVGPAEPHEVLGQKSSLERVERQYAAGPVSR
jgi:hypothetical protein